ncbi:MAG: TonB-dependent receptor [Polyangiaceae bacterium]|nr:TonB-dependent receptor [Polyangiaceae bacterium]
MSRLRRVPLFLAALACTSPAWAQEDVEELLDEPIVDTASRQSEGSSTAPATMTVVSSEDLERYGLRTLDEALSFAALGVVTTQPLHAVEIGARGVLFTVDYGNHFLLLIDGHALNEPWNGTAYFERGAAIPIEMVDRIEVVLGPGSVLYGSQAMLGVIHVVTKRPSDYAGARAVGELELSAPIGAGGTIGPAGGMVGTGWRLAAGGGETFQLFGAEAGAAVHAEYYTSSGPSYVLGPQDYGDDSVTGQPKRFGPRGTPGVWGGRASESVFVRAPSLYGKLEIGDFELDARVASYRRGIPYLDGIVSGDGDFDDRENREEDRWLNLQLGYRKALSRVVDLELRAYGDLYRYEWLNRTSAPEDCPNGEPAGCVRDLVGRGNQAGMEVRWGFTWPGSTHATSLVGLDARARWIDSDFDIRDPATGGSVQTTAGSYDDADSAFAAYAQQTIRPLPWLDLNAGVRGDLDPRFGAHASPRAAGVVSPWPRAAVKLVYAEAFRAPSAYELFYADPNDQIAADDLGPETVRSVEASFEQRFGTHRLLFGVFRSWWRDMVGYALLDGAETAAAVARGELAPSVTEAYQYRNQAAADNFGFNASWEGRFFERRLHYGLNLTSALTRFDPGDGSEPAPPTVGPQLFGNARLSHQLGAGLPTLGLALRYQERRPADRAYDGGFARPPYAPASLDARLALSGPVPGVRGLAYQAGVTYALAKRGPYVVGPAQYAFDETSVAELNPLNRLWGFAGLEYAVGE